MTFIAEIILVQLSFVKYVEYQPYKMLKMSMIIIPTKQILDLCKISLYQWSRDSHIQGWNKLETPRREPATNSRDELRLELNFN